MLQGKKWMVGKENEKPPIVSPEKNNELNTKNWNPWGEKPKRKLYEKETANIQLKKKQTSAPQALLHQHHSKAHLPRH